VFDAALASLRRAGAVVVDSVVIPEQDSIPPGQRWCPRFKFDLEAYLARLGPAAPVKTLDEIIRSGRFHPTVRGSLQNFQSVEQPPETNPACARARENQEKLRVGVRRVFAAARLDALVYPTWSNPPRLIGDLNTPHGDNSQDLSPHTGFPAFTVPMGWVRVRDADLPVGLQILGDAWSEPTLIEIAYGFEQATRHRRPPATTPPLDHR
jgi:Asp-tRNA(Asn)/Glu-tRNA(Gln) amidotransferase A subunit family amidase